MLPEYRDVYKRQFLDNVDFKPFTYIQKLVYLNNIEKVDVLKVTGNEGTYTLSIKREQVEETLDDSDDSDDSEDPLVAYRVNDTLTKEDLFKNCLLYTSFIFLYYTGIEIQY